MSSRSLLYLSLIHISHSKDAAFKEWRNALKFVGFSCELVRAKRPALDKFFYNLLRIANFEDMLPDNIKSLLDEMINRNTEIRGVLADPLHIFIELYAPYLDGFSDVECEEIKMCIRDSGYMGKRKFAWLDSVTEKAIAIREEQ